MGPHLWQVHVATTSTPIVDSEKCERCGDCGRFCPHGVFHSNDNCDFPKLQPQASCDPACRICARVCPHGAITFTDEEAFISYLHMRLAKVQQALQLIDDSADHQPKQTRSKSKHSAVHHR